MVDTYVDVNKLINYIYDRLLVEIKMGHEELMRCKTINNNKEKKIYIQNKVSSILGKCSEKVHMLRNAIAKVLCR